MTTDETAALLKRHGLDDVDTDKAAQALYESLGVWFYLEAVAKCLKPTCLRANCAKHALSIKDARALLALVSETKP